MKMNVNSKQYLLHFFTDRKIFRIETVELINMNFHVKSFFDAANKFREVKIYYSMQFKWLFFKTCPTRLSFFPNNFA
jgi:hypothetical protein